VHDHNFVIQCAIALPIIVGLIAYALTHWDRTPLHGMVLLLLVTLVPWLGALLVKHQAGGSSTWAAVALDVEHVTITFMAAPFLIAMGHFARLRFLELGRPLAGMLCVVPFVLAGLYLTDGQHGLFFSDRAAALRGGTPDQWAGPLYWAVQIWSMGLSSAGLLCLFAAVARGRTRAERRRALLVLGAVAAPIVAHVAYVSGWFGLEHSLAPAALGATAVLFVYGVEQYGVLDAQPIVRSDVLEHMNDALVLANPMGVVLDANAAAEALLRADRKQLRGGPVAQVLGRIASADEAARLAEEIACLAPGEGHLHVEIESGDGRVFELTSASVRAYGTEPAGVFLCLRDRSEHRRNEQLLRTRQKLESVGILAAGVAHEVNNPLAFVRANLGHLQSLSQQVGKALADVPGDAFPELAEMPEIVAECLDGVERIGRIVESMLRFSRAREEEGRPVDVNDVVREAISLADLHRDRRVELESRLDPALPRTRGSSDRLVQVLLNLFLNGKQALAGTASARLLAETSSDGESIWVRVRDNGPGIPEADLQRIFDPFFTTRGPDEGTGLGLSIAFDIVRDHGGLLEVESKVGEGSCFTIRLPVLDGETEAA